MSYELEATYYRTGLLLGLIQGEEVSRWTERVIEKEPTPPPAFLDLASVPSTDLNALRHGLWPLAIEPEPSEVLQAMFGLLYSDLLADRRGIEDTVTVLRQMRSMLRLPVPMYSALNDALVAHGRAKPSEDGLRMWLKQFALSHEQFTQ